MLSAYTAIYAPSGMELELAHRWEWFDPEIDPPLFAHFVGDVDLLPNGNMLIDHAGENVNPLVINQETTFTHLVEVDRATNEKVWEVVIRDESDPPASTSGYRAERLESLYPVH